MGTETSPIRDLIVQLRIVAQGHPGYCQVAHLLNNAFDHMAALARLEEINVRQNHDR